MGVILGARVLGEFGDDPDRYADAKACKDYAGTSPITRASGTKKIVLARYARNRRLADALQQWALCSMRGSPPGNTGVRWHDQVVSWSSGWSGDQLARAVVALRRPAVIAVDGVDGAGKTTFASHLAASIERAGRPTVIVHEDDFLAPRKVRHRRGRQSPDGFFLDSYDLVALTQYVLDPLGPRGDRRIRRAVFDHRRDAPVHALDEEVPIDAVVLVEGMFLHRDELAGLWDWSVFLDVPFTETARRMAERDGSHPDPEHPSMRRYVEGQRIYFATCQPHDRAALVLDNTNPLSSGIPRSAATCSSACQS